MSEWDNMKAFTVPDEGPSEYEKLKSTRVYQPVSGLIITDYPLRPVEIRGMLRELENGIVGSCLVPFTRGAVCPN
jgi:hypothetical protein